MHPQTRHKKLLENERINDWYENLKASSNLTADVYLRNLGLWLEWIRENPDNVIDLAKNDLEKFRKKIMRQIRTMEGDGKAGSYISVSLRPLLAYLKFYDVSVRLNNINIKDEDKNRTVEEERIPTKEELESIINEFKALFEGFSHVFDNFFREWFICGISSFDVSHMSHDVHSPRMGDKPLPL